MPNTFLQRLLNLGLAPTLMLALSLPAAAQETLRLGVEAAYPPFSELAPDGTIKGFDIDIGMAVCERLKARCTLVQSEFDAMIPALAARKFDAIVASMSITSERSKAVRFSKVYYESAARFVLKASSPLVVSPDGLKGKTIGVQRNTIHEKFAVAQFPLAKIVRYAKQDEVFLDLVAGRVDLSLADVIAIDQGFLKRPSGQGFELRGPVYNDPKWFGLGPGIAVRKADAALADRIDQALTAIVADGTYLRLASRYFAVDIAPAWSRQK
jgi:arginine/ornithine transport system substrate-binding protein